MVYSILIGHNIKHRIGARFVRMQRTSIIRLQKNTSFTSSCPCRGSREEVHFGTRLLFIPKLMLEGDATITMKQ
jgi:hypothetical protein